MNNYLKAKTTWLKSINTLLVWIFTLNAFIIPQDTFFNLKKIALIVMIIINANIILSVQHEYAKKAFEFGFLLTSFAIIQSIILTGEVFQNIKLGYIGYILLLLPVLLYYKIDFEKIFLTTARILAYFIFIMGFLHIFGILRLGNNIICLWFHTSANAMIGVTPYSLFGFIIFMKASPILLVSLCYFINNQKKLDMIVTLVAIVFSGTRANVFCGVAVFIISQIINDRNIIKRLFLVLFFIFVAIVIVSEGTLIDAVITWFERKKSSDEVRINTLTSIFNYWNNYPTSLLIGTGFSSTFYSLGRNYFVSTVELSYWLLLKNVGIPVFLVFMCMFFFPLVYLLKRKRHTLYCIGYAFYLIVAYTNPLLHSSTGLTVMLFMYYICYSDYTSEDTSHNSKEKNNYKLSILKRRKILQ